MNERTDGSTRYEGQQEPEIIRAEVVEVVPGAPWEWPVYRPARRKRRWRLPILLFVATCLSTLMVGMSMGDDGAGWFAAFVAGLRYAVPVMTILMCHEMGHFLQAHRHGVYASLPYFIPVPIPPIGTMGAVIAMEPRVGDRRALFDIGISGPLAGLVPTLVFCAWGLHLSKDMPLYAQSNWNIGVPLLFGWMIEWLIGPLPHGYFVPIDALDPMAFAGWVGLFITSLNLIPIGQLDGGHVLYALIRRKAHRVAKLLLFGAIFVVVWKWNQYGHWTAMLILLSLMGPIHPPTADDDEPLGLGRYLLGWLTLALIVVGFTPTPLLFAAAAH